MKGNEVRQKFLEFFADEAHRIVRSSSLVPMNDPTLLFTNAGMVQFKDVFTGLEKRDYSRAVTSQKCLRVSGKHNDLENVGRTARHHTFFEMLGNFSFGQYFKENAIEFGWEFLVNRVGLDGDRMWITVFREDDEAEDLWRRLVGVPPERIVRMDEKDNFWAMGDTGPCGPCSELIYDQGDHIIGAPPGSGHEDEDGDRYLELWNLVFMQFNREASGKMEPLPKPSVDTGMGLERLTAVVQKEDSNYHTDLLMPLIHSVEECCGKEYTGGDAPNDVSFRVIADHVRAVSFLVADGVLPSNEGRGYVLRRVARRALRHGRMLGIEGPFLHQTAGVVADMMGDAFPELREGLSYISRVTLAEEERFANTLAQGQPRMDALAEEVKSSGSATIPGGEVFTLLDTYGYPWDLAVETAAFHGLEIDQGGFDEAMEQQRERARAHWKGSGEAAVDAVWHQVRDEAGASEFTGYDHDEEEACARALIVDGALSDEAGAGVEAHVVLDKTPFYGEAGGQEGDKGGFSWPDGSALVLDTQKPLLDVYVHHVKVTEGTFKKGQNITARIDVDRRELLRRNHSATHLLQYALRQVLGDHVKQAGSHLSPERLRFDYTHFTAMTARERERVEDIVNERIRENAKVETRHMSIDDALAAGATALFGERYGEDVRVVSVGDFSMELCGGTHARAVGDIGLFRILHEGSVAAGVRRIEALTGEGALLQARKEQHALSEIGELTRAAPLEEAERVRRLLDRVKTLERELKDSRDRQSRDEMGDLATEAKEISGVRLIAVRRDGLQAGDLRGIIDAAKGKLQSGVAVVAAVTDGKVAIAAGVTKDLTSRIHAGNLVKEVASLVGGRGGGRQDFAQAGGKDVEKVDDALAAVPGLIEKMT
ncbi:MAG: alanine--tRNA ligase [Nitrospinae bacterium]|nr:alanine--tRNA ligase [Nitrospinota bacterium]